MPLFYPQTINFSKLYFISLFMRSKTGNLKYSLFLFSIFVHLNLFAQFKIPLPDLSLAFTRNLSVASADPGFRNSQFLSFKIQSPLCNVLLPVADTIIKKDRDGDGIMDSLDKCPDKKGVIQYDGCPIPDSDNDGIADDVDNCPTTAGLAKYKGCVAPDSDGDKINDEDDKCPSAPGVARYDGCPVGDKDSDGIIDDDDKCIDVAGTIKNEGCPENKKTTPPRPLDKKKKK